jgi:hypothetical protein
MKILAIGLSAIEIDAGCYGMMRKLTERGHQAYAIICGYNIGTLSHDTGTRTKSYGISSISETYFVEAFETSIVTQKNVKLLESIIRTINPSLIIIPYLRSTDRKRKVLSESSIIACRGVGNIIMYELDKKNKKFTPNIFCSKPEQLTTNASPFGQYNTISQVTANNTDNSKINDHLGQEHLSSEEFESYRVVLLDGNEVF